MLSLSNVLYAFLIDAFLFDTTFNTLQIVGAIVITFFNLISIVYKEDKSKQTQKEEGEKADQEEAQK